MKLSNSNNMMVLSLSVVFIGIYGPGVVVAQEEKGETMTKMCLFYPSPSGHARSDPIINQDCASDHVHTFYGPQNFHPNTSSDDLVTNTSPRFSTSPFVENHSLYWVSNMQRWEEIWFSFSFRLLVFSRSLAAF